MSWITQNKTKEELSNWLMENASDNETIGFLDMLAGDIWDIINAETELTRILVKENKKLKKNIKEYREWVDRNQAEIERLRDVIDGETDSEEEDDVEDNDPEEYGEYTWKEGLTAEEIAKGDTIDALTGEPIEKGQLEEEEEVVFLHPNDTGSIQDPEHPEDNYSFGNNCKSKIGDNSTMKRILKNGSIKDCVIANAYCMFVKGGKLYYQGRDSRGPAHVRTIKGEKTTMEFPY